jgi:hypothetical protein
VIDIQVPPEARTQDSLQNHHLINQEMPTSGVSFVPHVRENLKLDLKLPSLDLIFDRSSAVWLQQSLFHDSLKKSAASH